MVLYSDFVFTIKNFFLFFFFQAEDGIRDYKVTGVQTCALPICTSQTEASTNRDRIMCASLQPGPRARTHLAPWIGRPARAERSAAGGGSGELPVRGLSGPLEIALAEGVEMRPAHEDLRRDLAWHVLQEIRRDVGEVRVEVRIV